jgi:hypothetical protein
MGIKGKSKYQDIKIGTSYNDWTVIGEVFIDKYAKIPCRCKCGKEYNIDAYILCNGRSSSCITCFNSGNSGSKNPSWKGYKDIPYTWFSKYFERSNRKRFGDITIEQVYNMWIKQNKKCALSNVEIDFINRKGLGTSASIDRIDSKKEYTIENVQLVHKDLNLMKNRFDQNYFINMCKLVSENNGTKV